jgi:hypothetical protein
MEPLDGHEHRPGSPEWQLLRVVTRLKASISPEAERQCALLQRFLQELAKPRTAGAAMDDLYYLCVDVPQFRQFFRPYVVDDRWLAFRLSVEHWAGGECRKLGSEAYGTAVRRAIRRTRLRATGRSPFE